MTGHRVDNVRLVLDRISVGGANPITDLQLRQLPQEINRDDLQWLKRSKELTRRPDGLWQYTPKPDRDTRTAQVWRAARAVKGAFTAVDIAALTESSIRQAGNILRTLTGLGYLTLQNRGADRQAYYLVSPLGRNTPNLPAINAQAGGFALEKAAVAELNRIVMVEDLSTVKAAKAIRIQLDVIGRRFPGGQGENKE